MARKIESYLLDGPAGKIEALLEEPEDRAPAEAFLVCHPHPLHGGTMHNKVVYRLARGLRRAGGVVLRFNFRGVGRSQGSHDNGIGELEDARAALDWIRLRYSGLPFGLGGFSFGSRIALQLGCQTPETTKVFALGFPTRGESSYLESCNVSKLFIQSTKDEHGPREELQALYRRATEPKQINWIEAGDHFFAQGLDELEELVFRLASEP